jgi:hypothetical protein
MDFMYHLIRVEYASSCRANCRVCWNKIPKAELRMGKLSFSRKLYVCLFLAAHHPMIALCPNRN